KSWIQYWFLTRPTYTPGITTPGNPKKQVRRKQLSDRSSTGWKLKCPTARTMMNPKRWSHQGFNTVASTKLANGASPKRDHWYPGKKDAGGIILTDDSQY